MDLFYAILLSFLCGMTFMSCIYHAIMENLKETLFSFFAAQVAAVCAAYWIFKVVERVRP